MNGEEIQSELPVLIFLLNENESHCDSLHNNPHAHTVTQNFAQFAGGLSNIHVVCVVFA